MFYNKLRTFMLAVMLTASTFAGAEGTPQLERHELMEGVGKAAKVIGAMFRGEAEYDAAAVQKSLQTFQDAAGKFGDLFPEGSETGEGTEAAPAIWEDREGFNAALQDWADATAVAIAAAPATLDDAKPAVGPVFQACKGCHDSYRLDEE
jgi:cytochrome c556